MKRLAIDASPLAGGGRRVAHGGSELAPLALFALLALGCDAPATTDGGAVHDAAIHDAADPRGDARAPDRDASTQDDAGRVIDRDGGLPPERCPALEIESGADVGGFVSDVFTWRDARCLPRSAAMVRNDRADPAGHYGGYLRRFTYDAGGATRTCEGSSDTHPGFGYTVNHFASTASSSRRTQGEWRTLLSGRHHALHEYTWLHGVDGHDVRITIQWMFATGRDHPLWAITYDLTGVAPDAVEADTRSPYGDLQWDGGASADVAGVGWGDRYRFTSLRSPITMASGWDYTQPNTVPYVIEWTSAPDAEMGLVQTQTYAQHDGGGYWFYGSWGTRDDDGPMPEDWNWTFQLNQYELPFPNGSRSKRMAWGSNYGAVGQRSYAVYGDDGTASGYPYQSYAVFIVLGAHSGAPVFAQVEQIERAQSVTLEAIAGSVASEGPAGIARTDTATYDPPGWDPTRAAWTLVAEASRASVRVRSTEALARPTFAVRGWTSDAPARVTLDGAVLVADASYYASVDAAGDVVWITLATDLSGEHVLAIE